jgi:hypothetical protein
MRKQIIYCKALKLAVNKASYCPDKNCNTCTDLSEKIKPTPKKITGRKIKDTSSEIKAPNLSERLKYLIYNPELPNQWKDNTYHQRMSLLYGLFRLLNEDFQMKYGKYLDLIISSKMLQCEDYQNKLGKYAGYEEELSEEDYRNADGYKSIISFEDLVNILLRKEFLLLTRGLLDKEYDFFDKTVHEPALLISFEQYKENCQRYEDWRRKAYEDPESGFDKENYKSTQKCTKEEYKKYIKSQKLKNSDKRLQIQKYKKYIDDLQSDIIPPIIYPHVHINYVREKLIRDFTKFIDTMQDRYFSQHPNDKHPISGHLKRKSDGRPQRHDLDAFERYFKVHVYCALGRKQKYIAAKFPNLDATSISKDKKKANNLKNNAWPETKEFPGDFEIY